MHFAWDCVPQQYPMLFWLLCPSSSSFSSFFGFIGWQIPGSAVRGPHGNSESFPMIWLFLRQLREWWVKDCFVLFPGSRGMRISALAFDEIWVGGNTSLFDCKTCCFTICNSCNCGLFVSAPLNTIFLFFVLCSKDTSGWLWCADLRLNWKEWRKIN